MKYTLVTQRGGCHHFMDALFRSLSKSGICPDEIIVTQNSDEPGPQLHFETLKARNNYVLLVDHDVMLFDNQLVEEMYHHMTQPNVFACGVLEYTYNIPLLFPSCTMINRSMYLENGVDYTGSEPCLGPFTEAVRRQQKLVKIGRSEATYSLDKRMFHLNQGFKKLYSVLMLQNFWREQFDKWKEVSGSTASFDDYVVDDGVDVVDLEKLFAGYCDFITHFIENKYPCSMLLLGQEGIDFVDSVEDGSNAIADELKQSIAEATFVDHMEMSRGVLEAVYNADLSSRQSALYKRIGLTLKHGSVFRGTYCFPFHDHLFLVDRFRKYFLSLVGNRKILYAGPYDAFGEFSRKIGLKFARYEYYQFDGDVGSVDKFPAMFDVKDWDLVLVSGGILANVLVGRVQRLGGRGLNVGEAIFFKGNSVANSALPLNVDCESYSLCDGYKNYGRREFEKYLCHY